MSRVIWASAEVQEALCSRFAKTKDEAMRVRAVTSPYELVAATREAGTIAFADQGALELIAAMTHVSFANPIIGISDSLHTAIGWMRTYPWVSHVVSLSMLEHPILDNHLKNLYSTLAGNRPRLLDWLNTAISGRRVRLTHSSMRATRLDKMSEYLDSHSVSSRAVERLRDIAEELLTNAFYDAPVSAGVLAGPVQRTHEIVLPDESACDLVYGCSEDLAIVRVRDPFGSLSRRRLFEVLGRCAATDMSVQVDETMGGAGLGMWRIFSSSTFVAISVEKHHHTEILVGVAKRSAGAKRPFAIDLFFTEGSRRRRWLPLRDEVTGPTGVEKSVVLRSEPE